MVFCFFCCSRRRQTSDALGALFQTCALPILRGFCMVVCMVVSHRRHRVLVWMVRLVAEPPARSRATHEGRMRRHGGPVRLAGHGRFLHSGNLFVRSSEERRVGTECVSTWRTRWSRDT